MEREEWVPHYKRLLVAYNKTFNVDQAGIYFDALSNLPGLMVGLAVDELIKARGTWPHASDLREKASSLLASNTTYTAPSCWKCGGNKWVDSEPRVMFERVYQTVERCPECWTLSRKVSAA